MGEANRRGTEEQRIAAAIALKEQKLALKEQETKEKLETAKAQRSTKTMSIASRHATALLMAIAMGARLK